MPQPSVGTLVSVTHLLDAATPVDWHEAVALVRQAGLLVLAAGSGAGLPAHCRIWLQEDGALSLADLTGNDEPVTSQLATLLATVLPSSAPHDLQALADTRNAKVIAATPQEFIEALAFFARPDDVLALRPLYARAVEARQSAERTNALQALAERAREATPAASTDAAPRRKSRRIGRPALVGAAVTAVAPIALGAFMLTRQAAAPGHEQTSVPAAARDVARSVGLGLASAASFVRESIEGAPAIPAGRGADLELPARRRRPKPPSTDTPIALAAPAAAVNQGPVPDPAVAPARELPSSDGALQGLSAAPHGVYGATSADVIPPRLLRAQMPEIPRGGTRGGGPGQLDLLIGDDGRVISAKLVSASNRHQERMMISAAKAWRFAPATRNGQRVLYRMQMPITW